MIASHQFRQRKQSGFALIVTVIILSLLAVMAVAFLASSRVERGTARSVTDKVKADLMAQTAVNAAIASLVDNLTRYPDSATSWETITGNDGTVLYYRDKTPEQGAGAQYYILPLASGATAQTLANKTNALPTLTDSPAATANAYNFNRPRSSGDIQGWIGSSPQWVAATPSSPQPFRGEWINVTNSDGKVVSRYAYWMEDESFKANANLMGNTLRGSSTLGNLPSQIPFQGLLKTVLSSGNPDTIAGDTVSFRASFPSSAFFEFRALNQVNGQPTLADSIKFDATIFSGASNLSRSGSKRVDLNKVVVDSTDPAAIRTQLDEIIKTIRFHLPNFGQRFYRNGSNLNSTADVPDNSGSPHQTIYLNKVAANIRDYIDTDSQPTVVNSDGSVRIGSAPAHPFEASGGGTAGLNEVWAIGKERVPMMQEYALRVRQITFGPRNGATSATYKISIDHYMEFWNMSNRDIQVSDLGANPFVLVANQPAWDAGSNFPGIPESPSRDMKLMLRDARQGGPTGPALVSFPAGSCTVITTDPTPLPALTPDLSRVYYVPVPDDGANGLRTYSGQTNKTSSGNFRLNLVTRTTSNTDYETEICIGNDSGMLESDWGSGIVTSIISINVDTGNDRFDDTKYHFRGGSLRGNSSGIVNATTGDPRTMAEQIRMDLNGASAGNDKTRYFTSSLNDNNIPASETLTAPDSNFVDPSSWPDYSSSAQNANSGPMVIANQAMSSIGELGNIFDPVKTKGDAVDVTYSRSGGRTLKVGQPEQFNSSSNPTGSWDGSSSSESREWTAWRLTDIFSTVDAVQVDGRININGITRDNGAALKAALYGFVFQSTPDSDPGLAGQNFDTDPTVTTDKINTLISQIQDRLANRNTFSSTSGPFAERGELSELPMFDTGQNLVSGTDTAKTYDRGREELFRRLVELITTRGNTFTVYAAGQSTVQSGGNTVVASTSQIKVTFRIDPVWNAGTPADPFDPATNARFQPPDKYAIKILYAGE